MAQGPCPPSPRSARRPRRRAGPRGAANSELLAGTSLRNEAKIWLSSGCVHSTFAVSPGTTSPRGKFGSVKNAILLDGMAAQRLPQVVEAGDAAELAVDGQRLGGRVEEPVDRERVEQLALHPADQGRHERLLAADPLQVAAVAEGVPGPHVAERLGRGQQVVPGRQVQVRQFGSSIGVGLHSYTPPSAATMFSNPVKLTTMKWLM